MTKDKLPSIFKPSGDYDKRTYRAGIYAENQKFSKEEYSLNPKRMSEIKQLVLGETASTVEETKEFKPQDLGLDFNKSQDKAFNALQKLLDETDYKGNLDPDLYYEENHPVYTDIYNNIYLYDLPLLLINWTDFYKAYGLEKNKSNKYSGKQVKQAREALKSLADGWTIYYKRKNNNGKNDVIAFTEPLIKIVEGYKNIDGLESNTGKILIKFSPLFIDRIDTFYLYKPKFLHNEIKKAAGGRYSKYHVRLIQWLIKLNYSPKIDKKKLAYKLRMHSDINARNWKRIDERITKGLEIAQKLNFILDYEKNYNNYPDLLWIKLNPERCTKYKKKLEKQKGNNDK